MKIRRTWGQTRIVVLDVALRTLNPLLKCTPNAATARHFGHLHAIDHRVRNTLRLKTISADLYLIGWTWLHVRFNRRTQQAWRFACRSMISKSIWTLRQTRRSGRVPSIGATIIAKSIGQLLRGHHARRFLLIYFSGFKRTSISCRSGHTFG